MRWFTSDHHFGHKNVIWYCKRPFETVEQMNQCLIDRWNQSIKPVDTVYVLGDFSFETRQFNKSLIPQLNGIKILIRGNHDQAPNRYTADGFFECYERLDILMGQKRVTLSHYPFRGHSADSRFPEKLTEDQGQWLLHGHVHQAWKLATPRMINVGVDVWDFNPVSEDQIHRLIDQVEHPNKVADIPIDHVANVNVVDNKTESEKFGECYRKKSMPLDVANRIIKKAQFEGTFLRSYACTVCGGYHLTKKREPK